MNVPSMIADTNTNKKTTRGIRIVRSLSGLALNKRGAGFLGLYYKKKGATRDCLRIAPFLLDQLAK